MFQRQKNEARPQTRLEAVGKNSANYPVFRRVKIPAEAPQKPAEESEQPKMGRRHFLGLFSGALSTTALGGIAGISLFEKEEERGSQVEGSNYDSNALGGIIEEKVTNEAQEIMVHSDSRYFQAEVNAYVQKYQADLPMVLSFASKTTVGDPEQRNRMEYLSSALHINGLPDVVVSELQKYIVGLCDVESSFNAAKVSPDGALGVLQFMPATWKEHGDQNASALSLMAQVDAAQSKFKQIYNHLMYTCEDELAAIKLECFNTDESAFEKHFLVPVVINAFNVGQGTMEKMIKWFARNYGSEEQLLGLYGDPSEALSGYDVFFLLAHKGYEDHADPQYGKDAHVYVQKVYGATEALLKENKAI